MKLEDLASKPQLQEVIIDDQDIVKKYGEELQFFIQDRLSIETYTRLASIKSEDPGKMYDIVKDLILNEDGMPVMSDGNILPMDVMTAAVEKVAQSLGK
jgi:hypothetical protein